MKQLRLEILADYGIPEDVQDQFFHLAIEPDFPAQRQVKIMPLELFIDSARLHPFQTHMNQSISVVPRMNMLMRYGDRHPSTSWLRQCVGNLSLLGDSASP